MTKLHEMGDSAASCVPYQGGNLPQGLSHLALLNAAALLLNEQQG